MINWIINFLDNHGRAHAFECRAVNLTGALAAARMEHGGSIRITGYSNSLAY